MAASYKKLWKLQIDKDMKKEDLRKAAGLTTTYGKVRQERGCESLGIA